MDFNWHGKFKLQSAIMGPCSFFRRVVFGSFINTTANMTLTLSKLIADNSVECIDFFHLWGPFKTRSCASFLLQEAIDDVLLGKRNWYGRPSIITWCSLGGCHFKHVTSGGFHSHGGTPKMVGL